MSYVTRNRLRMTDEEIYTFLAASMWGRLGSVSEDGEPHVAPIGFHLHEANLYFHGLLRSRRSRDLKVETRVSLCVDDGVGPDTSYNQRRGVIVYGTCRKLGEEDGDLIAAIKPGYACRFFGDRDKEFERRTHAWFEIAPYRFASWDFSKIPSGADRMTSNEDRAT